MSNPPPESLKKVIFHSLLFHLLPQFPVDQWILDGTDASEAGDNENLDFLYGSGCDSPGLSSIEQYSVHNSVENPDIDVYAEL